MKKEGGFLAKLSQDMIKTLKEELTILLTESGRFYHHHFWYRETEEGVSFRYNPQDIPKEVLNIISPTYFHFKEDAAPVPLSEDFFYMVSGGGWCAPEKFLEEQDAKKVREAIRILELYRDLGIEEGFFEEI